MIVSCGNRTLVAKTCKTCGELKEGREFSRGGGGRRASYCKDCFNVKINPKRNVVQEKTLDQATRHKYAWTFAEEDRLLELREKGRTIEEIANELNRSFWSINNRIVKLTK